MAAMKYTSLPAWDGDLHYFQQVACLYHATAIIALQRGDLDNFRGQMRMVRQYMRWVRQLLTEQ